MLALGAVFLPFSVMQELHAWLGLGGLPCHPVTEYLARHTSLWYGFYGLLLWGITRHWPAVKPAVPLLAMGMAGFALLLPGLVLHCGLPLWWAAGQGVVAALHAACLGLLATRCQGASPSGS